MSDKWNFKVKYDIGDGVDEKNIVEMKRIEAEKGIEMYGVVETPKTKFEKECIGALNGAIEDQLRSLHLPAFSIREENIHVISPNEFSRKIPHRDGSTGYTEHGHVYIPRTRDRVHAFLSFAHEMSHAASFAELWLAMRFDEEGDNAFIDTRRLGHSFTQKPLPKMHDRSLPNSSVEPMNFVGLNEGVTELFAHTLLEKLSRKKAGLPLNAKETERAKETIAYEPYVVVIHSLLKDLAGGDVATFRQVGDALFRDYITGKFTVMKQVSEKHKGAVKLLFTMRSYKDALHFAETYHLTQAADVISNILSHSQPS